MKENFIKRKKNKLVWSCVLFIMLFLLILTLLFYFTRSMESNQESQMATRLKNISAQNSVYIKNIIDDMSQTLATTAVKLAKSDDLNSKEALRIIQETSQDAKFSSIVIDYLDGKSLNSEGAMTEVTDNNYIEKIKQGDTFVSETIQPMFEGKLQVSIILPVIKDGVIIGAVRGSLNTESILPFLNMEFFESEGKLILTDGKGGIIEGTDSKLSKVPNEESYFTESNFVGINEWQLLAALPKEVMENYTNNINDSAGLLVLEISLAFFTFFLFLLWTIKRSRDEFAKINTKLKIDEKRYLFMLERTDNIIFEFDILTGRIEYSEKFQKIFRIVPTKAGLPYSVIESQGIHQQDASVLIRLYNDIKAGKVSTEGEFRIKNFDGKYIWCSATVVTIFDDNEKPIKGFGLIENIHEKKEIENKYKEIQIYKNALDSDRVSIFEVNLSQNIYVKGYEEMLEMSKMEAKNSYSGIQKELAEVYIYPDDVVEFNAKTGLSNLLLEYDRGMLEQSLDFRIKVSKQKYFWARYKFRMYGDPISKDVCCIISLMDVNLQKCREIELMKKAQQDQLTGLYNKTTTENIIKEYLLLCDNFEKLSALLIIDIDNFKAVNDVLGHMKGDKVLYEIAQRLKPSFRGSDIIGRLGGDEFFVFMKNCDSVLSVEKKAKEVIDSMRIKIEENSKTVSISASVGIAICPDNGITFEELYKRADEALYISKKSGKDTYT